MPNMAIVNVTLAEEMHALLPVTVGLGVYEPVLAAPEHSLLAALQYCPTKHVAPLPGPGLQA